MLHPVWHTAWLCRHHFVTLFVATIWPVLATVALLMLSCATTNPVYMPAALCVHEGREKERARGASIETFANEYRIRIRFSISTFFGYQYFFTTLGARGWVEEAFWGKRECIQKINENHLTLAKRQFSETTNAQGKVRGSFNLSGHNECLYGNKSITLAWKKMDYMSVLPPNVQKWRQNISDTSAAILHCWCHLEPDSLQWWSKTEI